MKLTEADIVQIYARAMHGAPPSTQKDLNLEDYEVRSNWAELVEALGELIKMNRA